jgi:hypothetical protein
MYRLDLNSKIRPIFVTICCTFSLGLVVGGFPLRAIAQEYNPPDVGLPGRREGGGTRGCWNELATTDPTQTSSQSSVEELPTALTPAENLGYTTSERPTFFFYIPQLYAEKAVAADFMLVDEQGNEVYSTTFQPSHTANVISVTLPADSASVLELGKPYQWSFGLTCNLDDRSGDRVMDGWKLPWQMLLQQSFLPSMPNQASGTTHSQAWWHCALHLPAKLQLSGQIYSTQSDSVTSLKLPLLSAARLPRPNKPSSRVSGARKHSMPPADLIKTAQNTAKPTNRSEK